MNSLMDVSRSHQNMDGHLFGENSIANTILPVELLQKIFSYLDANSLKLAAKVSRSWNVSVIDFERQRTSFEIVSLMEILNKFKENLFTNEQKENVFDTLSKAVSLFEIEKNIFKIKEKCIDALIDFSENDLTELEQLIRNRYNSYFSQEMLEWVTVFWQLQKFIVLPDSVGKNVKISGCAFLLAKIGYLNQAMNVAEFTIFNGLSIKSTILSIYQEFVMRCLSREIITNALKRDDFELAICLASTLEDSLYSIHRPLVLSAIVHALLKKNLIKEAIENAGKIEPEDLRSSEFKHIFEHILLGIIKNPRTKDFESRINLITLFPVNLFRGNLSVELNRNSMRLLRYGYPNTALKLARTDQDSYSRSKTIAEMSIGLLKRGCQQKAEIFAQQIEDQNLKSKTMSTLIKCRALKRVSYLLLGD